MAKVGKQLMEQATTGKLKIVGEQNEQTNEILTPEALEFVLALHENLMLAARSCWRLDKNAKTT